MWEWLGNNYPELTTAAFALLALIQTWRVAKLQRLTPIVEARLEFGRTYGPLLAEAQQAVVYFLASHQAEKQSGRPVSMALGDLTGVQNRLRALEPYVSMIFPSAVVNAYQDCVESMSRAILDSALDPERGINVFLGNDGPFQRLTHALRNSSGLRKLDASMKEKPGREKYGFLNEEK
jgi:hypothetical protein